MNFVQKLIIFFKSTTLQDFGLIGYIKLC